MAAVDLDALRDYCLEDDPDKAEILKRFGRTAEAYLKDSGVVPENSDPDLYVEAVCGLALHFYDHREAGETEAPDFSPALKKVIRKLEIRAGILDAVSNLDTQEAAI